MSSIPASVSYMILKALGQEDTEEQYMVLMGPLTLKQLADMGMVKDSSVTRKKA